MRDDTGAAKGEVQISVVVVSYNTREMTLRCLDALTKELTALTHEVIVVDNASTDGSADAIAAGFPGLRLIRSPRNVGFGAGNNLGMREARGEYLLLINTDAFCSPGAVHGMLTGMDRHPKAAVIGPRLLNADGSLQPSCYRYPSPVRCWLENLWISAIARPATPAGDYRRWPHDTETEVDWLIGACMLVRREAYERVGGFDEQFFMYAEETDWQKRMRDAGFGIVLVPGATVTHLGGASGKSEKVKIRAAFFDSLDTYTRKHHGLSGVISMRLAMLIGSGLRALAWCGAWTLRRGDAAKVAASKVSLHLWLVRRQMTHWTIAAQDAPAMPEGRTA